MDTHNLISLPWLINTRKPVYKQDSSWDSLATRAKTTTAISPVLTNNTLHSNLISLYFKSYLMDCCANLTNTCYVLDTFVLRLAKEHELTLTLNNIKTHSKFYQNLTIDNNDCVYWFIYRCKTHTLTQSPVAFIR